MLSIILLVVVCLANSMLAAIVLTNNPNAILNRVFASLGIALCFWSVVVFLEDQVTSLRILGVLTKLDYSLSALLLLLFYWFCRELTRIKTKHDLKLLAIFFGVLVVLSLSGTLATAGFSHGEVELLPGPAYPALLIFITATLAGGFTLLFRAFRTSRGKNRAQYSVIGIGVFLTILMIVAADVVAPRIFSPAPADLTRLGIYGILFFTGFSTYAIIRHRFLDVRVLVARTITYFLLLVSLATLYSAGFFAISNLFFSGSSAGFVQSATSTGLAIILAFTFQPLRRFFERVTDRIFYRDRYDSQIVLNDFSKILVSELDLERIMRQSIKSICDQLHVQFGQIIVYNHDRVYRVEHFGPPPQRLMVAPELAKLNHAILVADELSGGERKSIMDDHGIRVSLTLRTREQFIGYLLLGDKLSGDVYSQQDIELLEIIVKELAVAVLNAKAYAEIEEFNKTLQDRVDHATSRLRVANRHLKELDNAKDEFISMASHQLRTPLTTIKGYLSMMLEGDAGKLTSTQHEFVDYAFGASERMVNLISDLLNVSRLSAGRFLIQTKPTDMVAMVKDEVRQLQSHAAAKNLQLTFTPPAKPLPPAEIDENKTRQVVMNFIDNAIYYTQSGSVTVVLDQAADNVRLEVFDTGIGVPEAAKKKLFSKFFRADNAQTVRPDGTGLGLYLARRVVEDQGGTIIFNSVEGKGSTFGFELPLKAPPTIKT